jgi:hypothetical protein
MQTPSCPHCGTELPHYRNLSNPGAAELGHIALCVFCESFSVVAQDFSLRLPDRYEAARLATDPAAARAIDVLRTIKAAGRGGAEQDPVAVCPGCGRPSPANGPDGMPVVPTEGALSICFSCGCVSRYTASLVGLFLRPLSDAERDRLLAARLN